ncbi:MAG: hypothetical protein GWP08_12095, partial [Nitrospiraceae bacterium]|nr:hypothetical protein [Nitrospiraceae bacterium]
AGVSLGGWGKETLIERSLEALRLAPPSDPDTFDFIVVGDSNTLKPLEQSEVFRQSIKEFNLLEPNFVVEVGDIVLGGAAEGVPAQWDLFDEVIAAVEPPYFPLPGNHDISDAATEQLWRSRLGPTHYSFEYGNSQFILLNSEEVGAVERISDEQVAWLTEQLDASTATNIFVFLHQPYFEYLDDPETLPERWEKHWSNVARAFEGHPVKAVFSGHQHLYRDCGTREGVRYVISGGASVYGMRKTPEEGSFNHYLLVRVRNDEVSWLVIKPYSILPENAVTSDRIGELYNIRNKYIAAEEVFVPLGEPVNQVVNIAIKNLSQSPMKSSLTWETEGGWTISPTEAGYEIPGGGTVNLSFSVKAGQAEEARWPVPVFKTLYTQTQHGPAVNVEQALKFVPTAAALRVKTPVQVDGVLDEWETARMVPLTYPIRFDVEDTGDLSCKLGFLWDDAYLYMAVETQDNEFHQPYAGDIVWSADNVEMFLDDWSWGLSLTEAGPEVFLYWGVDVSAETVNTDVALAVKGDGTRMIYEAAFPASHLTPLKLAAGNSFRFNAIMNDLDPAGPVERRHWLELCPGAGSKGRAAPRVKIVLNE